MSGFRKFAYGNNPSELKSVNNTGTQYPCNGSNFELNQKADDIYLPKADRYLTTYQILL